MSELGVFEKEATPVSDPVLPMAKQVIEKLYAIRDFNQAGIGDNVLDKLAEPLTEKKFEFLRYIYDEDANEVVVLQGAMIRGLKEWGVENVSPDFNLAQLAIAYKLMLEVKAGKRTLPVQMPNIVLEEVDSKEPLLEKLEEVPLTDDERIEKTVGGAMSVAKEFLLLNGLFDVKRHEHLETVADRVHIAKISPDKMASLVSDKYGMTMEEAQGQRAFYIDVYGDTTVDMVLVRNDIPLDLEMDTHEFIHRAAWLGSVNLEVLQLDYRLLEITGYSTEKRKELMKEGTPKANMELNDAFDMTRTLREGVTQWTTRELNRIAVEQGNEQLYDNDPKVYQLEVKAVDWLVEELANKFQSEKDVARALVVDLAVTGDFSKLEEKVGEQLPSLIYQFYFGEYLSSVLEAIGNIDAEVGEQLAG